MSLKDKLPDSIDTIKANDSTGTLAREAWRVFGIMAEFVESTERLQSIKPAVSIFGSARTAQQFHVLATGVTRFALGKHDVKNAVIALPPVAEQETICRWITDECQPLDDAIARTEEEIKLIREYRDRLIADVVTGQVDVRGWQPGLDDVVDDTALSALGDDLEDVTEEEDGDGED